MRVFTFLFFAGLLIAGCKSNSSAETSESGESTELQTMEAEVMVIHDEVMPKMNDINDLSAQLREIRSNVVEDENGKSVSPEGLDDALKSLKLAEQAMWDWMKAYSDTKATLQEDQLKPFYEKEMEKITKVRQDMLDAIQKAQTWIEANPK